MKGLTLTQPWANLLAYEYKRIETRSWGTSYRGPVAIHAARNFPKDAREYFEEPYFASALSGQGISDWQQLPTGCILAVAELVHVVQMPPATRKDEPCGPYRERKPIGRNGEIIADYTFTLPPPYPERAYGFYEPGRFAWWFTNVQRLPEYISCRGMQRLWNVPGDIQAQIEAMLRTTKEAEIV